MDAEVVIPSWIDAPAAAGSGSASGSSGGDGASGAADWNTCILGDAIIPGVVTIEDLEVGIDIDHKKSKGKDKPTSTDTGLSPSKFKIRVWLNSRTWPEFQQVAPSFQPRRPGRARKPLQIIHPLVNFLGISEVRVAGIKMDQPTAKGGMVVKILCVEWFDKPVEAKKDEKKAVPANPLVGPNADALDKARRHALALTRAQSHREMLEEDIDPVTGKPASPGDEDMLREHLFSGQQ